MADALHSGFGTADADSDGQLTFAEANFAQPDLTADEFGDLDADSDGFVTDSELAEFLGVDGPQCFGASGGVTSSVPIGDWIIVLAALMIAARHRPSRFN